MFKFVVVALTVNSVLAYEGIGPVTQPGSCPNGCALSNKVAVAVAAEPLAPISGQPFAAFNFANFAKSGFSGLTLNNALNNGYGAAGYAVPVGPLAAAIQSTHSYEVIPVNLPYEAPVPQLIEVEPYYQPVNMIFRTQSSPLNLQQVHTPAAPIHESTRSEDEPSIVTHESYKPVIQEYREVIQPQRKIEQKILPVIEHVHTVVAKGEEYRTAPAAPFVANVGLPDGFLAKGGYKKAKAA